MSPTRRLMSLLAIGTAGALALSYYVTTLPAVGEQRAPIASHDQRADAAAAAARTAPVASVEAVAAQWRSSLDISPRGVATLLHLGSDDARHEPTEPTRALPEGVRREDVTIGANGLATIVRTSDPAAQATAGASAVGMAAGVRPADVVVGRGGVLTVIRSDDEGALRGEATPSVLTSSEGLRAEDLAVGPGGVVTVVRVRESSMSEEKPAQAAVAPKDAGAYAVSPSGVPTLLESADPRSGAR